MRAFEESWVWVKAREPWFTVDRAQNVDTYSVAGFCSLVLTCSHLRVGLVVVVVVVVAAVALGSVNAFYYLLHFGACTVWL